MPGDGSKDEKSIKQGSAGNLKKHEFCGRETPTQPGNFFAAVQQHSRSRASF
jgi:hypothetical protein